MVRGPFIIQRASVDEVWIDCYTSGSASTREGVKLRLVTFYRQEHGAIFCIAIRLQRSLSSAGEISLHAAWQMANEHLVHGRVDM